MRICPFCNRVSDETRCPVCGVKTVVFEDSVSISKVQTDRAILNGKYFVQRPIAKGGTGNIYLGVKADDQQVLAIKIIDKKYVSTPADRERFKRGVLACSYLTHENIMKIYDYGWLDTGEAVVVMDYIKGGSLREFLKKYRKMEYETAIDLLMQVASALSYSHKKGVVHRDIKPANLMLDETDGKYRVVIADFGVARWFRGGIRFKNPTATGVAVGTPAYMSPEQINGEKDLDGRADVYGLGVVAYEMLTGYNPFKRPELIDTIKAHLYDPVPDFPEKLRKNIPLPMQRLIIRMLKKDRQSRVQSADAVYKALTAIKTGA